MATFFSNQTVGSWSGYTMTGTLTGNVGRSGNTVTLSSLSCTFKAASAWGTDSGYWSAIYNGNTQLTRSNGLSMSSGTGTKSYSNVSITVGASDTSHQFNFRTSDGKTVYFTVTFPSGQTEPATPTISAVLNADETVSVTWGTTSLGNPTGTVELYGDTNADPSTELASKSTTGNTTFTHTGLNPGTTYYYKAYASNSVGNKTSSIVSVTTPEHAKLYGSVNGETKRVKKLYGSTADVDKLPTFVNTSNGYGITWTLDGRTLTINGQNNNNGNSAYYLVDSNNPLTLPAGTYYCPPTGEADLHMQFYDGTNWYRMDNTNNYSITISASTTFTLIYMEVSKGKTTTFNNYTYTPALYSTTGVTKEIKKLYGSVNGQTKLIYQG